MDVHISWTDHLEHLECSLSTIQTLGLTLHLKKCSFAHSRANFFTHMIGEGRIEPDPDMLSCLQLLQAPVTKKEVRRIVSFFRDFRSLLPALAETAGVLT